MRRKPSKLVFLSAGATLAWFLDPVSGRDRRRQVADQLKNLTGGGASPAGDPTGGATPPAVAQVQPIPPAPSDPDLAQAVEAASGGEKVLRTPAVEEDGNGNRSTLRATW